MASREESNRKKADNIKKIAIDKINSMSDRQIDDRVIGLGEAKFSIEATVKMVLGDFASFVRSVEHFRNEEYDDVKRVAVDAVLPIFGQKVLEEKSRDMSKLGIAEKRQILIDNVNKQTFNLCEDNAKRAKREYNTPGSVRLTDDNKIVRDLVYAEAIEVDCDGDLDYLDCSGDEPVVVNTDAVGWKFTGAKTCTIRFLELKNGSVPKFKQPEQCYHHINNRKDMKEGRYKVLLSSYPLDSQEVEALKICFRKNNRQYKLDRKVLQDIINGKINKKAPDAIALVKSSKRK